MKVLDLNAVISDTEVMLRRTLGSDVRMTAIFASTLDPIRADARKVQQVILSLVARARRAMPTGGRFTIETKNVRLDKGQDFNPDQRVAIWFEENKRSCSIHVYARNERGFLDTDVGDNEARFFEAYKVAMKRDGAR